MNNLDAIIETIEKINRRLAALETLDTAIGGGAAHHLTHENGGGDEVSVAGLSGLLADDQNPTAHKADHENGGGDEISVAGLSGLLADDQNPTAHKTDHENGGGDEISVAGLSGLLADDQNPTAHASDHNNGGSDILGALQWLTVAPNSQTIAGGAITTTTSYCVVDTEGGAATDNLDTINGGTTEGTLLFLRTAASARDVVVKNGTGNIRLIGGTDVTLNTRLDVIVLQYHSTSLWVEVSYADNP